MFYKGMKQANIKRKTIKISIIQRAKHYNCKYTASEIFIKTGMLQLLHFNTLTSFTMIIAELKYAYFLQTNCK